ncbi:hypothetical protein OIO90_002746 [Microbotryomycetes sp. JL221]|nr:hypothetical protein OIO90_002746 [Microbotryomycetes sp. JL221]
MVPLELDEPMSRTHTPPIPLRPATPRRYPSATAPDVGCTTSPASTTESIQWSPILSHQGSPASPRSPFDTFPFFDPQHNVHRDRAAPSPSQSGPSTESRQSATENKGKQRNVDPVSTETLLNALEQTNTARHGYPNTRDDSAEVGATSRGPSDCMTSATSNMAQTSANVQPDFRQPMPNVVKENAGTVILTTESLVEPNSADSELERNTAQYTSRSSVLNHASDSSGTTHQDRQSPSLPPRESATEDISRRDVALPPRAPQTTAPQRRRLLAKTTRRLSTTLVNLVTNSTPDLAQHRLDSRTSLATSTDVQPTRSNSALSLMRLRESSASTRETDSRDERPKWKSRLSKHKLKMTKPFSTARSVPVTRVPTIEQGDDVRSSSSPEPSLQRGAQRFKTQEDVSVKRRRSQSAPSPYRNRSVEQVANVDFCRSPASTHSDGMKTTALTEYERESIQHKNLFSDLLPRELQLKIVRELIVNAQTKLDQDVATGVWSSNESRKRWVGQAQGRKDVVRLSRVSREWRSLAYDGQHWQTISTAVLGNDILKPNSLLAILQTAGPFVRHLDLRGASGLTGRNLMDVTNALMQGSNITQLTSLDLAGCTSLTSASLHDLIVHSPFLTSLNLMALRCVVFTTINVIEASTPLIQDLNLNRCPNLNAAAITKLVSSPKIQRLQRLQLSNLTNLTDEVVVAVFKYQGLLTSLNVSHNVDITDQAFKELSHNNQVAIDNDIKTLYGLQKLNLSGCTTLSDVAMKHLAGCVPNLATLELADMGPTFHPTGLIELLKTVPNLTNLDIEHGLLLTDSVLTHLPTKRLTKLIVNCCPLLTSTAMLSLIESSPNLVELEADGTMVDDDVARVFVTSRFKQRAMGTLDANRDMIPSATNPLSAQPILLSLLDARFISRRFQKEVQGMTRPRTGQRGHWTLSFGSYHDNEDLGPTISPLPPSTSPPSWLNKKNLAECDETKVVVRSFYGNLSVDVANVAARYVRKVNKRTGRGSTQQNAGTGRGSGTSSARSRLVRRSTTNNGVGTGTDEEQDEDDESEEGDSYDAVLGRRRGPSCIVS